MKKNVLLFTLIMFCMGLQAQDLSQHRWKDRVILLFAANAQDSVFKEQFALLTLEKWEVTERDLIIYQIFPTHGYDPKGKQLSASFCQSLRRRHRIETDAFQFILIGKDSGVKKRAAEAVSRESLFGLIDRMPMRRAEMRRGELVLEN